MRRKKNEGTSSASPIGPAASPDPLRTWPRAGGPETPDGPLRLATGPKDFDGLGRERFWDQTPEERGEALRAMTEDASKNIAVSDVRYLGIDSENKAFAKGWLAELDRVRRHR